ncbi:MAG TPA: hypothetical protein DCP55_00215 [Chitinophagaceae bacterium]|nr:hypothetical protein [Chitinophagaceae bacterium]
MFKTAMKEGLITGNPVAGVEREKKLCNKGIKRQKNKGTLRRRKLFLIAFTDPRLYLETVLDLKDFSLSISRLQANAGMVVVLATFLLFEFVTADEYQPTEVMTNNGNLVYYQPALENWYSVGGPYGEGTLPKDPSNCLIVGIFKVVKDEEGAKYFVADLTESLRSVNEYLRDFDGDNAERMAKKRETYNRHYFISTSLEPEVGQSYTFSYNNPMKVIKRIKKRVFEVELPLGLKNDHQIALDREEAKNRAINEAAKKTAETRRKIQEDRIQKENNILDLSSLEQARKNAALVKGENELVFKNLYIGMTTSDALWILKDLLEANFKFKDGTDFKNPKGFKIGGKIEIFTEPPGRNIFMDILDQATADRSRPVDPNAELMKDELFDSRPHMDLYFDQSDKIVCFSIPRSFLNKMFEISDITDQQFFDMFKSNYNIQGEITQVNTQQDNAFLTMLSDKFSPQFSLVLSLIDPRGVKIDFVMPTDDSRSSTLILQKWSTPKEINDSFN